MPDIDVFSLGSFLYATLKGHWPYRDLGSFFDSMEEMEQYGRHIDSLFKQRIFPEF